MINVMNIGIFFSDGYNFKVNKINHCNKLNIMY